MRRSQADGDRAPVVGIFAKRPRPGAVKTRLEPALGPEGAAGLAAALLEDAARRLAGDGAWELELAFAPADERPWFAERHPDLALRAQRGPDLGARLEAWFADVLGAGAPAAVVVGSDGPWTSAARVAEALARLADGAPVVLGPDLGGGYYLAGLGRPVPGLFTEVPMSTAGMFDATVAWLEERGLAPALLDPDYDLDLPADLERLAADLAAGRPDVARGSRDWPRAVEAFLAGGAP